MIVYSALILTLLASLAFFFYYLKLVKQKNRMIALLSEQNKSILKTQKELSEAKDKAEESDKLKSAFLANMSHEIRTPLNAIMGFSSLMQDSIIGEEEKKQFVSIIHANSTKLLSLMDEIFEIAKIESGLVQMQREPCHVNELVMSLVTFFNLEKSLSGKDNIQIRMHKPNKDTGFTIYTDPKIIRQTLFNLVENALKYTSEGSIEIGYELKEASKIEFYVRDTGIGFPQEKLDILFQRFRQADDSTTRQYGGIGLGLTLSQKFVELMEGEMRAESRPGSGSIFYVSLPYGQKPE
ncbi:MAG: ATP-binding protein [Bacteroidota bacterium]